MFGFFNLQIFREFFETTKSGNFSVMSVSLTFSLCFDLLSVVLCSNELKNLKTIKKYSPITLCIIYTCFIPVRKDELDKVHYILFPSHLLFSP